MKAVRLSSMIHWGVKARSINYNENIKCEKAIAL